MNKLTLFSKLVLFLTSYIPLGIIFLIIDYTKSSNLFFKSPSFSIPLLGVMLALLLFLFSFLSYFKNKSSPIETMKVINVNSMDGEILSYIFTYILPFLGFPSDKQLPISLFLLIIIGILYIKSDMIGINPILSLCGFHILKVELEKDGWKKSKEVILISQKDYFLLKHSEIISTIQIEKSLYLLKEIVND